MQAEKFQSPMCINILMEGESVNENNQPDFTEQRTPELLHYSQHHSLLNLCNFAIWFEQLNAVTL